MNKRKAAIDADALYEQQAMEEEGTAVDFEAELTLLVAQAAMRDPTTGASKWRCDDIDRAKKKAFENKFTEEQVEQRRQMFIRLDKAVKEKRVRRSRLSAALEWARHREILRLDVLSKRVAGVGVISQKFCKKGCTVYDSYCYNTSNY